MATQISSGNTIPDVVCLFNNKMSENATRALEQIEAEAKAKNLSYMFVSCGNNFSGLLFDPNSSSLKSNEDKFNFQVSDTENNTGGNTESESDVEFDLSGISNYENEVFF
jgi:hypothetical protein